MSFYLNHKQMKTSLWAIISAALLGLLVLWTQVAHGLGYGLFHQNLDSPHLAWYLRMPLHKTLRVGDQVLMSKLYAQNHEGRIEKIEAVPGQRVCPNHATVSSSYQSPSCYLLGDNQYLVVADNGHTLGQDHLVQSQNISSLLVRI